jgi:subtilisin family serine protease
MRRAIRFLVPLLAFASFGPVASLSQHITTTEKINPQLRRRAQAESRLGVFVVLRDQPQQQILERVNGSAALRIGIAEGEYHRLSSLRTVTEDSVQAARDRLDQLMVEARQTAARDIETVIRPQREAAAARLAGMGATVVQRYTMINMLAVDVPASAISALEADPDVVEVAPIEQHRIDLGFSVPGFGAQAFWNAGFTGGGQSVAVLDTGIKTDHPAFAGKDIVSRAFLSYGSTDNCFNDILSADDRQGHGSHVAGIIASGGAAGFAEDLGVARGLSRLYNLKIGWLKRDLPACQGNSYNADVYAAIDWALQNTPVRIFNYSYGGGTDQDDTSSARFFDQMVDQNKLIIAISAGNSGPEVNTVGSPGLGYNIISVANYDDHQSTRRDNFDIHYSSSRGPTASGRFKPDIAAPGTSILSTDFGANGFVRKTGTSMAAPHVAGAAALLVQSGVTDPLAVKALLINTTDNIGWRPDRGWGYANLAAARNRSYYFLSSASASGAAFYTGAGKDDFTATLVWNRHITGLTGSTTAYLNHLGLYLYNRTTNTLLSKSEDSIQNVQQVTTDKAAPVVVKVRTTVPLYAGGINAEPFAVAMYESGFTPASGPALSISCTPPATVAAGATFSVSCTARNAGDLDAFAAIASPALPSGFSNPGNQAFGSLAPGVAATQSFSLKAAAGTGKYPFQVTLTSSSYGEVYTATANFDVTVGGSGAALAVSPGTLAFSAQAGGASPAAQSVAISGGAFSFSASASAAATWLRVTPAAGTSPASLQVSVSPGGLAAGVYNGALTVIASGAANSPQVIAVTLTINATATVTPDTRVLTKSVPSGCAAPAPVSSFLASDARALVWFQIKNAQAGDRARAEWYSPNGAVYQSVAWDPVASSGSWCFWAGLDIAGSPPASLPGNWSVKIYWNGSPAATLPFLIGAPVTVANKLLTRSADLSACAVPAVVTQFLPRDTQSEVWFSVTGAHSGDQPTAEWYSPDGKVFQTDVFDPLPDGGDWCFSDSLLISGNAPASMPGTWTVKVYWNSSLIFTLPFTIVPAPSVIAKATTSARPTSCAEPPANSIFLPRDARATVWFYVQNVQPGDRPKMVFYDPGGNQYEEEAFDPTDSGGDWCFWAWINVAGQSPASTFGTWIVKVSWNDVPLFSTEFQILPVAMDSYVTARTVNTSGCEVPASAQIFTPADQRAYVWFHVKDAPAGELPQAEFYDPGGGVYDTLTWDPVPAAGGTRCFWGWIDVAGKAAASKPGKWSVKVYWNKAPLLSVPFTVTAIAYDNAMVTKALPGGNGCPVPVAATSFAPSDPQASAWFLARNARAGDQPSGAWYDPNGKVYRGISWSPVPEDGNWCYSSTLSIRGQEPASFPGQWKVKVNWNGSPLFSLDFKILDNAGAGSVSANTIMMNGRTAAAKVDRAGADDRDGMRRDAR